MDKEKVEDSIRLLRIAALGLKSEPDRGRAFSGLIDMQLTRNKLRASRIELKNIRDDLWRVRARILTADYHLRKGRTKIARRVLAESIKLVPTKGRQRGADDTYLDIAKRQAAMGDYDAASATARLISIPMERLDAYLLMADGAAASRDKKVAAAANKMFNDAFILAKKLKGSFKESADVLLRIAHAQIDAKQSNKALITLQHLRPLIIKAKFDGWADRIANMAGAFVLAGDNKTAMGIVRSLEEVRHRTKAMSEVASAIGTQGNIEAAVPLFSLAFQETSRIGNAKHRFEVIRHLVNKQAKLGRHADAFKMAGFVRNRRMQALTMLAMGEAMIEVGDYKNAETVTDYIPYIGMRSQIFTALANVKGIAGQNADASELLTKGLADPTISASQKTSIISGSQKISPESREHALMQSIDIQSRVGATEAMVALFVRIRQLSRQLPIMRGRVAILSKMAVVLANNGEKKMAQNDLDIAWRLAWRNTQHEDFAEMLSNITDAQLAAGFVLQALDTAARIPDEPSALTNDRAAFMDASAPPESPRNRALRNVAMAAGTAGRLNLSIRAVRAITDETARAYAISRIATAIAKAER